MNKNFIDSNKDIIFSKLSNISNLQDSSDEKNSNYKKLSENYKTSLQQLQKGNKDFLQKFNTMYANSRYSDLNEYIESLNQKSKKNIETKKIEPKKNIEPKKAKKNTMPKKPKKKVK